jgi:integrase
MRSRTFDLKRDANAFEAKVKLAKRSGDLAELDAGKETFREFDARWWKLYAVPRLAPATVKSYTWLRTRYLLPKLGDARLRNITPSRVQGLQAAMISSGVGEESTRKALALLQGMFERAVEWGHVRTNPVKPVKKPGQQRKSLPRPLAPAQVEVIRRNLLDADQKRDATLITLMAYAGLRPGEALALRWRNVQTQTLVIEQALSLGELTTTKTKRVRSVRLLTPLSEDIEDWRRVSAPENDDALMFPTRSGTPWADTDYRNWRTRRYRPAVGVAGLSGGRPYDLRHSFASLMFASGSNPAEIAAQLGHSLQTLFGVYVNVIEELRGRDNIDPEAEIRAARAEASTRPSRGEVA